MEGRIFGDFPIGIIPEVVVIVREGNRDEGELESLGEPMRGSVTIHTAHGLFSSFSHTYSTLTHNSHTHDSSFSHLLHYSHTRSTMTHLPLSVLLLYIWLDTYL